MTIHPWADIALRSSAVYLAMLAGLRLAGKRPGGQISPHDMVLMLLVANAVQNAMVGPDTTLHGGLIAATTLILLNAFLGHFVLHHHRLGRLIEGEPTLLVHNGRILDGHLARESIRQDELEAQLRAHGFETPEEVKNCTLEVDGSVSVCGFHAHTERRMPSLRRHRVWGRKGPRKDEGQ